MKPLEGEEYTINDIHLILGNSVNVSTIPTQNFTVLVDLLDGTGMAYILAKTGKVKGIRDVFSVKKVIPWERIIFTALGKEGE